MSERFVLEILPEPKKHSIMTAQDRKTYTVRIKPFREGGGYAAYVPDLAGCVAYGESPATALKNATNAIRAWLKEAKEANLDTPEPSQAEHLKP